MTTLVVPMTPQMAKLVARGADILQLPSNADFALKAMGALLRTIGIAPKQGRPVGYSQRRARAHRAAQAKAAKRRGRCRS